MNLLLKAIAEHKNEAVRAESKARVLQVLAGTRIDVVIELLEELLEHLRAMAKEEAPEEPKEDDEEEEEEEEGEDEDEEAAGGEVVEERGESGPREGRLSKASQVRAALAGGPLPRDRLVMQLAALPPGADATTRESRRTIQSWRQMLSNLQRQGDLELLASDQVGLTARGREKVVLEQRIEVFRKSEQRVEAFRKKSMTGPVVEAEPSGEPVAEAEPSGGVSEPTRSESPSEGFQGRRARPHGRETPSAAREETSKAREEIGDAELEARSLQDARALEEAWVEMEALVADALHRARRAMPYRDLVEHLAGNAPQILIRSLKDVAPHTRLGAVVRKTLLRLQAAGKVTTDPLDSSRWKGVP